MLTVNVQMKLVLRTHCMSGTLSNSGSSISTPGAPQVYILVHNQPKPLQAGPDSCSNLLPESAVFDPKSSHSIWICYSNYTIQLTII